MYFGEEGLKAGKGKPQEAVTPRGLYTILTRNIQGCKRDKTGVWASERSGKLWECD